MEKQLFKRNSEFFKRLLILFSLVLFSSRIFSYEFVAKKQKLIQNENIEFVVEIPNIFPQNIKIDDKLKFNESINFISLKKTEFSKGTKITLVLCFLEQGEFLLNPVKIQINENEQGINFPYIFIAENTQELYPKIKLSLNSDKIIYSNNQIDFSKPIYDFEVGKNIQLKVELLNSKQILKFDYELPLNSICKTVDILDFNDFKEMQTNKIALFEWKSLKEGNQIFPQIKIIAKDFNENTYEICVNQFIVNFTKNQNFNEDFKTETQNENIFIEQLFLLNENENSIKKEELQQKSTNMNFYKKYLLIKISLIIVLIVFFMMFIFFAFKRKFVILIIGFLFFLCFLVFSIKLFKQQFALTQNCVIYSIPEITAISREKINDDILVKIKKESENWVLIEFDKKNGWCKKEDLIILEK